MIRIIVSAVGIIDTVLAVWLIIRHRRIGRIQKRLELIQVAIDAHQRHFDAITRSVNVLRERIKDLERK